MSEFEKFGKELTQLVESIVDKKTVRIEKKEVQEIVAQLLPVMDEKIAERVNEHMKTIVAGISKILNIDSGEV